jgi:putative ABC transport system substrate-binding protein
MRRRDVITLLGGAAAAWPLATRAQQPKVWRIGLLDTASAELNTENTAAFSAAMRELGYVEGQNLTIEYRTDEGRTDRLPDLVADLLRLKVDAIVLRGTQQAEAVKNATSTVPVVMAAVADAVSSGIVATLAHPGTNFTGLVSFATELSAKRVELLRELIPTAKLFSALQDGSNPISAKRREEIEKAARTLGIEVLNFDVRNAGDVSRAFDESKRRRVDAIYVEINSITRANRRLIVELAAQYKLPAIYEAREFIKDGGLIVYGVSYPQLYTRAATFVDKIFKGAKPADLPVEQPSKLELVVNLKAAMVIGLQIPPSLLARADEVIE